MTALKLLFNGEILEESVWSPNIDNRSFLYGDGLFETIRLINGKVPLASRHFKRLKWGTLILAYEWDCEFTEFEKQLYQIAASNQLTNAKIRFQVFRKEGGLYQATHNDVDVLIRISPFHTDNWEMESVKLGLFKEPIKVKHPISGLKSSNSLAYVLAGQVAKETKTDEVVVLNQEASVADSLYSNIFVVKGKQIFTPPLDDGPVAGVMRDFLLEMPSNEAFSFQVKSLSIDELSEADEIFLSNALKGIKSVSHYLDQPLKDHITSKVIKQMIHFLET